MSAFDDLDLGDVATLRDHCRVNAMLDAILNPDEESRWLRVHRHDTRWRPGVELATFDNGAGDVCQIVFDPAGVLVLGFDHESPMNLYDEDTHWPGLLDSVPTVFAHYLAESEFLLDDYLLATCCFWRQTGDDRWRAGTVELPGNGDDGTFPLSLLLPSPESYQEWATAMVKVPVDLEAVRRVFAWEPLTDELVTVLNPAASMATLAGDITRIGYPRHG